MFQYIKSLLPTWPDYVLKDWIYGVARGDHQAGVYFKPDADFGRWGFNRETVFKMIADAGLSPDTKWQLIPNMKFTMDMFEPNSKRKLIGRAGGSSDMGMGVPKDAERHATQAALAQQQGGIRKEPVILIKTPQGYELLEGWHRTIQHFARYPDGYVGPAYVAVAQSKPGITESMAADQVLDYVKRTHAPDEFDIEYSITDHPEWELKTIPLSQLNLDPDGEAQDPYNRVNWVDDDKVQELIPRIGSVLKSKPIVVDPEGWIIDGNHRAMAAVEAGLTSVPALVPVKQGVAEEFLGEYPSIETTLGEATHPDLVKYDKNFQKQLHRDLDVGQGKGKKIDIDYHSDEKDWSDLTHIQDYTGGSVDTNDYLHRQYRNKAKVKELTTHQAKIQALDRILANHKLPQQIVVYTGLRQSPAEAWETYGADVTKPIRLHLPAYTSTTTKLKVALTHAGEGEIAQVSRARHKPRNKDAPADEWGTQILMMTLPAGLPAASVKKISEFPRENEILLPRGIDIEINPSPTVLKGGDFVWHATVLSHSPVQIAPPMQENFADGKNPGRKGLAKRSGVNTKASVSSLRKTAKNSSGEKQRMAHWLANMKAGRAKARKK